MGIARHFKILGFLVLLTEPMHGIAQAGEAAPIRAGQTAPAFSLVDTNHKRHALMEWRGRPTAVFFFCGCIPCHQFASLWAQAVQDTPTKTETAPMTVVIFSGEAPEAKSFAAQTHLNLARTVLLLDTQERTADRYGVTACPRVFALDAQGLIGYTNDEPGSDPQKTASVTLVSRMLTAIRAASLSPKRITPKQVKKRLGKGQTAHV